MNKTIISSLLLMSIIIVFAQTARDKKVVVTFHQPPPSPQSYDGKTPPLIKIDEAYTKALLALGKATNQFYCISATSLTNIHRWGTEENSFSGRMEKGWAFAFSSTNGAARNVYVCFDKTSSTDVEDPAQVHQGF
jgi:hypothetical protein